MNLGRQKDFRLLAGADCRTANVAAGRRMSSDRSGSVFAMLNTFLTTAMGMIRILLSAVLIACGFIISGCAWSALDPAPSYAYSLEFHGEDVPDLKSCKVIHWKPLTEPTFGVFRHDHGYGFLYDIMLENGIRASLTTEGLIRFTYGRKFDSLKYVPERFGTNVAEICSILGTDNEKRTFDEFWEMGGSVGGFDKARAGEQAKLAIRGFVYGRTYGGKDTILMTVESVYRNKFCFYTRAIGIHRSPVVVARVYVFYNYEGVRFATLTVQAPHRIAGSSYDAEINAAKKSVDLAFKEFLKGDGSKRVIRGRIKGNQELITGWKNATVLD